MRDQKTAYEGHDEVVELRRSSDRDHLRHAYLCCDWVVFEGVEKRVGRHVFFCGEADVLELGSSIVPRVEAVQHHPFGAAFRRSVCWMHDSSPKCWWRCARK